MLDEVREQLGQFADALDENRDLTVFFFSPYFSSEEKKEALDKAVAAPTPASELPRGADRAPPDAGDLPDPHGSTTLGGGAASCFR